MLIERLRQRVTFRVPLAAPARWAARFRFLVASQMLNRSMKIHCQLPPLWWMDGWIDRKIDRWMDGWMDGSCDLMPSRLDLIADWLKLNGFKWCWTIKPPMPVVGFAGRNQEHQKMCPTNGGFCGFRPWATGFCEEILGQFLPPSRLVVMLFQCFKASGSFFLFYGHFDTSGVIGKWSTGTPFGEATGMRPRNCGSVGER